MKKFLTIAFLFCGLSFSLNAQECSHAKAASEKASCTATSAEAAAAADASIVKKVNLSTGETYYVRKDVCPTSGKVSFAKVEFCNKSKQFTNVSPSKQDACCTKDAKNAQSESAAGAVKTATTETKTSCCASKAQTTGSGCCAGKAASSGCGSKAEADSKPVETTSLAPKAATVSQKQ